MCGTLPGTLNEVRTVNVVGAGFGFAGVGRGAACVGVDVADGRGAWLGEPWFGDAEPGAVAVRLADGHGAVCEARCDGCEQAATVSSPATTTAAGRQARRKKASALLPVTGGFDGIGP